MNISIWLGMAVKHLPLKEGEVRQPPEITHQPVAIVAAGEVAARVKATLQFGINPDDTSAEVIVVPFG